MRKLITTGLLVFILIKATYANDNNNSIIEEKDLNQNKVIEIETGRENNPIPLPVVLLSLNGAIQEDVTADPVISLPIVDDQEEEREGEDRKREPIIEKPNLERPVIDRPIIDRPIIDRPIIGRPSPSVPADPSTPEPEPNLFPIPDKPLDQELEEYANGFWRFYDKRPLLGNFVLGVIIIGLMYVFFLVSNFISETTGEKHWLAAILTEPYEQIVPVISMLFSKKDKK
jgi:hypothetical protein